MPAGPSKRPPDGTVSECEPSMMVRRIRLGAVHAADQIGAGVDPHLQARLLETTPQPSRPSRKRGENDRRV